MIANNKVHFYSQNMSKHGRTESGNRYFCPQNNFAKAMPRRT